MIFEKSKFNMFALSISDVEGKKMICLTQADDWRALHANLTAVDARRLSKAIAELASVIDPPPKEWQIVSDDKHGTHLKLAEAASAILQKARARKSKKRAKGPGRKM